jgi:hypothetical protein
MEQHSLPMMQLTRDRAAFRLRQLLDEFQVLVGSFPDLHDAFDPDDLPLAFILRRDSRLPQGSVEPSMPFSARPDDAVRRQTRSSRTARHRDRRKQTPDE